MILGNAGIVTIVVTTTSSLITSEGYRLPITVIVLVAGIYLVYKLLSRGALARKWEHFIENRFAKSRILEEATMDDLLHLIEGYGIVRVIITPDSPLVGCSITEGKLPEPELFIIGIERGSQWMPFTKAGETIREGDKLVVYGDLKVLKSSFKRA